MFEQMIAAIQEETLRRLFLVRLRQNQEVRRERGGQGHRRERGQRRHR